MFVIWDGSRENLLEFVSAINTIGENGSLKLIGYLNKEGLCSNLHLIAVMLESKMLLLSIYLTLVLLLVTNLPIRDRNTTASANFAPIVKEPAMYFFQKCAY